MKNLFIVLIALIMFQCKPAEKNTSTASLENTYWKLLEINGKPVATPENTLEAHIVLSREGTETRLKGFAGCNNMGGNYTTSGNSIKFTVMATKMLCPDRMEIENFLFSVLEKADHYKIKGERLELYQSNTLLTTFESVYLK